MSRVKTEKKRENSSGAILARNDQSLRAFGSNFAPSQQWALQTAFMALVYSWCVQMVD